MEEQVISIEEIFEALKKRWKMIALITILATVIAGVFSFFIIDPVYEASTKLFVGKEENSTETYNSNDIAMYQKLLKTYSETIKTRDLLTSAIKDSKYDLEVGTVSSALTVVPVTDTQILQIKYQSKDPKEAEVMLKAISNNFIKTAKELVPNGNVRVIEAVETPKNPVSPNKVMNIAIAFLLGLMVSVGLVFLLEYLDNTYKNKEQLEKELEIPVLGIIPNLDEV
ncbi:capsular biosynthesis protein [Clostridium sp. NSJ-49]|uniref:YveK family protein n=1 Tax=Clostridium TaxID=1485 RepID=UPI00164B340A|nr:MULTISPECIES: Wzz/FepE/Etk N-terminal domain-containing protein [unclassified Clostridium]MBC5624096.1 capsular biosynthesis protein [Clostridium sp. NSJ-49]MCD2502300.1 Wzz/FepE/Etk N-terminal domain-containing protein [Clostridium sp. NSJ-145]